MVAASINIGLKTVSKELISFITNMAMYDVHFFNKLRIFCYFSNISIFV